MKTTMAFVGWDEFEDLIDEIQDDWGEKDAKNIMRNGARASMAPVLSTAQALVPRDTGQLAASLQVEARKPTARDKRSKYSAPNEIVIGLVTVAPGSKFKPRLFHNLHNKKNKIKQYATMDARAVAVEFGTHKMAAHPFLRPALESNSPTVLSILSETFGGALEKYRSKHMENT